MSRASKIFFAGSCALTAGTIWAVHHIQVTEQANMYQGVIKDEARVKAKQTQLATQNASSGQSPSIPSRATAERQLEYERNLKLQESLKREQHVGTTWEDTRTTKQDARMV
ncbi:hypothetical protein HD553DRAFT_35174 [Filobasidium floriforme]|uniref:uncharacterized protein n=1 Tax=Filobasidium floriforme TaxID=5210 RepID=UPI001E8ED84C|nr:uncharacterized protein HD553DRAFT_35174 [Filobasidium floriforme]KAH8084768.1 hypothetical protein HD553DRAFT_35174 [Filobasidium floriforme]